MQPGLHYARLLGQDGYETREPRMLVAEVALSDSLVV
jgi:hypothetical protein